MPKIRCLGMDEFGAIVHRVYLAHGAIYVIRCIPNENWCEIFPTRLIIRSNRTIH